MTASAAAREAGLTAPFDHPGLLYRDTDEYLAAIGSFVRSARDAGDAVLVAVPEPNLGLLRGALADIAEEVTFADMAVAGRNPGRIIPGVLLRFAAAHPDRRVSIVGEPIWADRSEVEYPACAAHEALINAVFASRDATILCPYNVSSLSDTAVDDAWRTHPVMVDGAVRQVSHRYTDPLVTAASFNRPLPSAPSRARILSYDSLLDLSRVRRFVADHASALGLPSDRVDDLVIAVNELAGNTVEHTAGGGRVSIWAEDDHLVCQVADSGHVLDPLTGRVPPPSRAQGGHGLLLANHLCDLFRMHTDRGGTTIRLHMRRREPGSYEAG